MTSRSKLLIAAAALALAATPSYAGDEKGKDDGGWFAMLDADGDGAVTREEAQKVRHDHFAKADADGDGGITLEEMKAHHDKMMEGKEHEHDEGHMDAHFKELDANGDGKVTLEEAGAASHFDEIDADKDGKITRAEADAHHAKHEKEHKH